jgi:hypothetical protein
MYFIIFQDGGRSDDADASVPWTRTQAGTVATEQVQIFNNRLIKTFLIFALKYLTIFKQNRQM